MREDDLAELLKFDRKVVRTRVTTLRRDRLLDTRQIMESCDGKKQKVTCHFINYKVFKLSIVTWLDCRLVKAVDWLSRRSSTLSSTSWTT